MRVFASDLDGCLADAVDALDKTVVDHFGNPPLINPDSYYFYERFGLDKGEVDAFIFSDKCFDNPAVWAAAEPLVENIEEMAKWCLSGMVPSIITARPPHMRMVTEIWCAKYAVPYSNLILGAGKNKGQMCYHIDASFMIEDRYEEAIHVTANGTKVYLLETKFNLDARDRWAEEQEFGGYNKELMQFVQSFKDITQLEGIDVE